jgi:hypothetical protein
MFEFKNYVVEFISNMQSIYINNIELISNMLYSSIDTIEFPCNVQSITNINMCLVTRLKMQVDYVFIYVCFATAVNLGTLELTLLYDPVTAALTCSLHRAKVGATFNGCI